jgi:hypothetical protein
MNLTGNTLDQCLGRTYACAFQFTIKKISELPRDNQLRCLAWWRQLNILKLSPLPSIIAQVAG